MRGRLFLDHTLLGVSAWRVLFTASLLLGQRRRCKASSGTTRPAIPFTTSPRATSRAPRPTAKIRRGLHDRGLHDDGADGSLGLGRSPRLILAVGLGARDVARGDFVNGIAGRVVLGLLALHVASWPLSQSIGRLPVRLPQQERRSEERRDVRT